MLAAFGSFATARGTSPGGRPPGTPRWPQGPHDFVTGTLAASPGGRPPGTPRWPQGPHDFVTGTLAASPGGDPPDPHGPVPVGSSASAWPLVPERGGGCCSLPERAVPVLNVAPGLARSEQRARAARERLLLWVERTGLPALVLTRPGPVSWLTGGLPPPVHRSAATDLVWAVVTGSAATLITTKVEADRIREEYQPGQHGFEGPVAVPWYDPDAFARAAAEVAGVPPITMASDGHPAFGTDASDDLTELRLALSGAEQEDLRALGADAAQALEAALAAWSPGERDLDIQARVAAHLEARGADTPVLIVGGDERVQRFRHPMAAGAPVRHLAMAVVVARRGGLHAAATRFACAGPLGAQLRSLRDRVGQIERDTLEASLRQGPRTGTCSRPWTAGTPGWALRAAGPGTTRAARSATRSVSSRLPRASGIPAGRRRASSPATRSRGTRACPAARKPRIPTSCTLAAWSGSPRDRAGPPRTLPAASRPAPPSSR